MDALRRTGPLLTRERLRATLATGVRSGLSLGRRTVRAYHLGSGADCTLGPVVTF